MTKTSIITHEAVSDDPAYNGIEVADVVVYIIEDGPEDGGLTLPITVRKNTSGGASSTQRDTATLRHDFFNRAKARNAANVTPNDEADLPLTPTSGLYVGVSGDVVVTLVGMPDGSSVTLGALTSGVIHPFEVKRVWATGTTAQGIVAVY